MRRLFILLMMATVAGAALAQEVAPKQALRFGVRVAPAGWEDLKAALAAEPADPSNPAGVTLSLPAEWAKSPDWPALDAALAAAGTAKARLCVTTGLPGAAMDEASLAYLAALSEHAASADTLGLYLERAQFSDTLTSDADRLALILKQLTTALRGRSHATILLGDVTAEALPIMDPLYDREFRAYVEGYSSAAQSALGEPDDEVVRFLEAHHPGAPFLVHLKPVESPIGAQVAILVAASKGVAFVDMETGNIRGVWHALVHLRSLLSAGMAEGFSVQATEIRDASGPRADIALLNLLDSERMVQAMALVPVASKSTPGEILLKLPTGDVSAPSASPLPEGARADLGYTADQKAGETVLRIPWSGKAQILFFSRLKTGTVGQDTVSITGTYTLPVEIILARHQAVQQPQDQFLEHYSADARVEYHFKLPGGTGSLDVTFMNMFFYQKGQGARWVQNQMLLNGVAWKGKTIPNLPIIEPDKVNTLPLSLTLGRDYTYKYLRDEAVEGHPCFVVDIVPAPGSKLSLYSGKVWIDKETYVRRKMSVRQTGLKDPQVSNDETDTYAPVQGPDGRTYWLLTRLVGQQIFSVAGTNIAAEREITFSHITTNAPGFSGAVKEAESSDKPILEETHQGLRYLKKDKEGNRVLEMNPDTHRWFAVAGTYYDKSLDYPLPLVGVNYFNYDFKKTKTQVNIFLTGVVNTLTISKVELLPKFDGSANAVLFAIPTQDRVYPSGAEDESQRVKILREYANMGLGWRATEFSKVTLRFGAMYYGYSKDSKTASLFRLPKDHFDLAGSLDYSYSRRGWGLSAAYDAHRRTAWEEWGMPGEHADAGADKDYAQWQLAASKSFHLPQFQKVSVGATWMDGRNLDRFSKYLFSYLGRESLVGFSGSGVRFDRGAVARFSYDFNIANVIRFGLKLDQGRVQPVKGVDLWQNHTGVGLSGAVTGPWQTYWTLDLGYALRSDIPAVQHGYTAALVVLKVW